jgi:membrane protein required for colicin V production
VNGADLAIVGAVALSAVIGLVRGFVAEAMSLVAWAAAIGLSLAFGSELARLFEGAIELPSVRLLLGHALVFIAALAVGAIVTWLLRELVHGSGLSGSDRFLGALFGVGRGVIAVALVVTLLGLTALPRDPWWRESRAIPAFQTLTESLLPLLPEGLRQYLDFAPAPPASQPPAAST